MSNPSLQSELSPSQLEQLNSLLPLSPSLPTASSILATEQSRLLFREIRGSDEYKDNLKAFSSNLLDELVVSNPRFARVVRRTLHEHRSALSVLVHSLAHVASYPARYKVVAISLNASDYQPSGYFSGLSYTMICRLARMLTAPELGQALCWKQGGAFDRSIGSGVRTRITPFQPLNDAFAQAGLIWSTHPLSLVAPTPKHLVVIKDRETHERRSVGRDILPSEAVLTSVNARLRTTTFKIHYPDYRSYERHWDYKHGYFDFSTEGQLFRQFVDNEKSGGRIIGHGLQNLPKDLRRYLTINGESVYEYDYQGMHVHLAYAELWEEPPPGDPYEIPGYGPEHRDVFKACFVSAVGTDKDHSLMSAFSLAVQKHTGSFLEAGKAAKMAEAFWNHHKALKKLANTEAWRGLQYTESEIMLKVLARLESEGIPAIPMHDAVIVPLSRAYDVKRAMNAATREIESLRVEPARWTLEAYPQFHR